MPVENNRYKILLIEDDKNIRNMLDAMLTSEGYQLISANTCSMGKTMYSSYHPDIVILDLGLPDSDGMAFLRYVRADSVTPIMVLSARTGESDKVLALDAGANDYVTKPFGTAELMARIRMLLRNYRHRAESGRLPGGCFKNHNLRIDYDARRVFEKESEIKLSQTEYNIIAFLSEHCGKMLTYQTIIKEIWGYPDEGSVKKLQVNMANIRKKFNVKPGEKWYISNELGVGYRMNGENDMIKED